MDLKKAGCKKAGSLLFKKRNVSLAALPFLNNNDPVYSGQYFGPDFFQGHKPTHVFKTRIVGAD